MSGRILLVAEGEAGERLSSIIRMGRWELERVELGASALKIAIRRSPWLVLVHTPEVEHSFVLFGQTMRQLRELDSVLLVFVTKTDNVAGRLRLLECGADQCWSEALDDAELLLRLQRLRLKPNPQSPRGLVDSSNILFDTERKKVTVNGTPIQLTPKQLQVLGHFLQNRGRLFTTEEILNELWANASIQRATVGACIRSINRLLSNSGENRPIRRSRGAYVLR